MSNTIFKSLLRSTRPFWLSKRILFLFLPFLLISASTLADENKREEKFYIFGAFGSNFPHIKDYQSDVVDYEHAYQEHSNNDFSREIGLGYRLNNFRIELGYTKDLADLDFYKNLCNESTTTYATGTTSL